MHDAGGDRSQTVAALPKIIAGLRERGYQLVTVPRLLLDNPAPEDQAIAGSRERRLARRPRKWRPALTPAPGAGLAAAYVRDAVPARLGRELDRLAAAVGLDVDERVHVGVERMSSSPSLTRWSSHAPRKIRRRSQWTSERSEGPDELGPAVVDVLAEGRRGLGDLAVDDQVDQVLAPRPRSTARR